MMTLLAEMMNTPPDTQVSGAWVTGFVVAIIGAIASAMSYAKGTTKSVNINPQPLAVKMEDDFVTRREFENLESRIRQDVTEMKGLFARTMDKIEERDKALSSKIEAVASGAYEARRRIHEKVNNQGERLKSLEDRTPVKRASAGN